MAAGAVLLMACGGGGSSAKGSLLLTRAAGLVEHNLKSGNEKLLIPVPEDGSLILDPALSADATQITYIVQPRPKVKDNTYDDGSDLWIANRDGSGARAVFPHAQRNQFIRNPQWQDGEHILAVVQETNDTTGPATYQLERFTVADGTRQKGPLNVLTFSLAPDGKRIVFALLGGAGGETLHASDFGGGNDAVLVKASDNLSPFGYPRYAPDGSVVAFASADQTGARAQSEYVSTAPIGAQPAPGYDGVPEDIWTVDLAGGKPVRIATLKEDLPSLTWSGSPARLYALGANGLYDINVKTGSADHIGEGSLHGQLTYAP